MSPCTRRGKRQASHGSTTSGLHGCVRRRFPRAIGARRVEARERPLVAKRHERVEERRRRGRAGDGHADGHEQVARPSSHAPQPAGAAAPPARPPRKLTAPTSAMTSRAAVSASSVVAASQRLGTSSRRLDPQVLDEQEVDQRRRWQTASAAARGSCGTSGRRSSAVGHAHVGALGSSAAPGRPQERQRALDQLLVRQLADPLAVEPLEALLVENGAARWTRSSSKRSASSSREKISSSVPLDQPSSARKLTNASGM